MEFYLGEIRAFGGSYAPSNFLICDGSLISVNEYQALFSLIGTTYGGTGVTTFGIPDLRGRLAVGQGQGTGLTLRPLGSQGGTETVQLASDQIPPHNHNFTVSTVTNPASVNAPVSNASYLGVINSPAGTGVGYLPSTASGAVVKPLNDNILTNTGGGDEHNNLMPFLCVNYIICVNGIYPPKP